MWWTEDWLGIKKTMSLLPEPWDSWQAELSSLVHGGKALPWTPLLKISTSSVCLWTPASLQHFWISSKHHLKFKQLKHQNLNGIISFDLIHFLWFCCTCVMVCPNNLLSGLIFNETNFISRMNVYLWTHYKVQFSKMLKLHCSSSIIHHSSFITSFLIIWFNNLVQPRYSLSWQTANGSRKGGIQFTWADLFREVSIQV